MFLFLLVPSFSLASNYTQEDYDEMYFFLKTYDNFSSEYKQWCISTHKKYDPNIEKYQDGYDGFITTPEGLLTITRLSLRGKIPNAIGLLKNLKSLKLNDDNLQILPPSFRDLVLLEKLDIYGGDLTELDPLSELVRLQELRIANNSSLEKVPVWIGKLSDLRNLQFACCDIKELPESIGKLTHLEVLKVSGNSLVKLPESIGQLKNLYLLDASSNKLTKLPKSIGMLSNLTKLGLHYNQLTSFPKEAEQLSSLDVLTLDNNKLSELPESILKLHSLTFLTLHGNESLHVPFNYFENIKVLTLPGNQLLDHRVSKNLITVSYDSGALWKLRSAALKPSDKK